MNEKEIGERISTEALQLIKQMMDKSLHPVDQIAIVTLAISLLVVDGSRDEEHLDRGITMICKHIESLARKTYQVNIERKMEDRP